MMDRLTGKKKEEQFTALEPVGRMGQPEEIANVVWMCSDEASVTGHAMAVRWWFCRTINNLLI
jgi:NAD(P)-dependent dehydrogenase (short-subunit alcohol dehydrogenase family)